MSIYKLEALDFYKRAIGDVSRAIWKLLTSLAIRTVVYIASKLPMNMEELQYNNNSAAKSYVSATLFIVAMQYHRLGYLHT